MGRCVSRDLKWQQGDKGNCRIWGENDKGKWRRLGLSPVLLVNILYCGFSWHHILLLEVYGVRSETFVHWKWLVPLSPSFMCLPTGRAESVSEAIFFCWKNLPTPLKKKSALTYHVRQLWDITSRLVWELFLFYDPMVTWTHLYHLKCHTESSTNVLVTSRNIRFTKDRKIFLIISGSTGYRKELGLLVVNE